MKRWNAKQLNLKQASKPTCKQQEVSGVVNRLGSMMTLFFTDLPEVKSFADAMTSDTNKYANYFKKSLESGIYLAPSQFESLFVSAAHTDKDIDTIIAANKAALQSL